MNNVSLKIHLIIITILTGSIIDSFKSFGSKVILVLIHNERFFHLFFVLVNNVDFGHVLNLRLPFLWFLDQTDLLWMENLQVDFKTLVSFGKTSSHLWSHVN